MEGRRSGQSLVFSVMWMREKGRDGALNKLVHGPVLHMTPKSSKPKGTEAKFSFDQ